MIKAVVQSIPTYFMSVFKLPVGLCKDIEAMIRKLVGPRRDKENPMGEVECSLFV